MCSYLDIFFFFFNLALSHVSLAMFIILSPHFENPKVKLHMPSFKTILTFVSDGLTQLYYFTVVFTETLPINPLMISYYTINSSIKNTAWRGSLIELRGKVEVFQDAARNAGNTHSLNKPCINLVAVK